MTKDYVEHEIVVLLRDHHENGLRAGDVGAIVHVYSTGEAYEIRHLDTGDLLHVRQLTSHEESRV